MFDDHFIREVRVSYLTSRIEKFKIKRPEDVATFVRQILTDNSREHFVALYLSAAHEVVSYSIVSIGTANKAVFHPREIFQRAILSGAISIVISHNHPSGSITPSREDEAVTSSLAEVGRLLTIPILDHVIVTDESYASLKELNGDIWPDTGRLLVIL